MYIIKFVKEIYVYIKIKTIHVEIKIRRKNYVKIIFFVEKIT